jgi:hypothetical protein
VLQQAFTGGGTTPIDGLLFTSAPGVALADVTVENIALDGFPGAGVHVCGGAPPDCDGPASRARQRRRRRLRRQRGLRRRHVEEERLRDAQRAVRPVGPAPRTPPWRQGKATADVGIVAAVA